MGRLQYKEVGSDHDIGSSCNYLNTFPYFSYNIITPSLNTLLLYESLHAKNPETIVIVSLTGCRPLNYCDSCTSTTILSAYSQTRYSLA